MANNIHLRIGNTYCRLPNHEASLDRSGRHRKIHDWVLFVDVRDDSLIERVKFDLGGSFVPSEFICRSPVPTKDRWLRFSSRQQSFAFIDASIQVRGTGGSVMQITHEIQPRLCFTMHTFSEYRSPQPLKCVKLGDEATFGIELELTVPNEVSIGFVQGLVQASGETATIAQAYSAGREVSGAWKLVPDSSIMCSRNQLDCNTFELVSPILRGGGGLGRVNQVVRQLNQGVQVSTNKTTGFHVHVDVSAYSVRQIAKICQQFVKYEQAIDTFMAPWRRTGSEQSLRYFRSNRDAVRSVAGDDPIQALAWPSSFQDMAEMMNPDNDRYFKLNLQNIVTGRQPTLEFRQHASTAHYEQIVAWVRFCTMFCRNAALLQAPGKFSAHTGIDAQVDALFWYVVKDRALRDFYRKRRAEVGAECCSQCAHGGYCKAVEQ